MLRMTFKRYIAGLLLICFSVFLGHNLVPHHHHSEVLNGPIATDCPFGHSDTQEHDQDAGADEHPTHCHAFNDVVFQKQSIPALRSWTDNLQAMFIPGQPLRLQAEQTGTPYMYAVHKPPFLTAVYPGSEDLRAPPGLA